MASPFLVPTGELFRQRGTRHRFTRSARLPGVSLSVSRLTDDDV